MIPEPDFPTHLQIQTTTACGAACSICPHPRESPDWPNGLMSDELFDRIVGQLAGRQVDYVSPYLMADPLSDKRIFQRIARLRQALPQAHLEVSTTGMYLLPGIVDRLLAAPLSELRISSHGITAEEYAQTMPGVKFDQAMANIRRFCDLWKVQSPYPISVVCLWGLWPEEREAQIEAFWARQGIELSKWRVISRAQQVDLTVFGKVSPDPTPFSRGQQGPPYLCRFHRDTQWMHILSDGRVTLCCMDYGQEVILGDARESTLEEIFNGPVYRQARALVSGQTSPPADFLCHRCEWHVSRSVFDRDETPGEGDVVRAGASF